MPEQTAFKTATDAARDAKEAVVEGAQQFGEKVKHALDPRTPSEKASDAVDKAKKAFTQATESKPAV
jgi:hypothetical protein